tara:strand:+ start:680 stop:829 length:150 start_codon:yes stop_codon:yes gene_type:complete
MSKAFEVSRELIDETLSFVAGSQNDPSKEHIYVEALQKALMTLHSTNFD